MKKKNPNDESQDVFSIQSIDFFAAFKEIEPLIKNKKEAEELFYKILNHENYSTTTQSYEVISNYIKKRLKSLNYQFNSNDAIFNNYINLFKQTTSPSTYQQFLFFVQLYSIGKISHRSFINLTINLLSSDLTIIKNGSLSNLPHIKFLPSFMSTFNNPSLSQVGILKGTQIEDYCSEIIVGLTSYAENYSLIGDSQIDLGKIASKCLQCLGMGLINIDIAKFWLSKYFPQEYFMNLDKIPDYAYIIPSQYPHEVIGCSSFEIKCNNQTAAQMYVQNEIQKYSMLSLNPVAIEVYEKKLQLISKLLDKIRDREKIEPNELLPFFGEKNSLAVSIIIERSSASKEINLLTSKFNKIHDELVRYLCRYLQNTIQSTSNNYNFDFSIQDDDKIFIASDETINYTNYRYIYNAYLRSLTFCKIYEFPGTRELYYGSLNNALIAIALVRKFITVYFGFERAQLMLHALSGLMPLFISNNYDPQKSKTQKVKCNGNQSISSHQIAVLAYLSEIAQIIGMNKESNFIKVIIDQNEESSNSIPYFNENDQNKFTQELLSIPVALKEKKEIDYLSNISVIGSTPDFVFFEQRSFAYKMQSIDLILTLLVRQLNRAAMNNEFTLLSSVSQLKEKRIVPIIKERAFENTNACIVISVITSMFI